MNGCTQQSQTHQAVYSLSSHKQKTVNLTGLTAKWWTAWPSDRIVLVITDRSIC